MVPSSILFVLWPMLRQNWSDRLSLKGAMSRNAFPLLECILYLRMVSHNTASLSSSPPLGIFKLKGPKEEATNVPWTRLVKKLSPKKSEVSKPPPSHDGKPWFEDSPNLKNHPTRAGSTPPEGALDTCAKVDPRPPAKRSVQTSQPGQGTGTFW